MMREDLAPGELARPRVGVGQRGVRVDVLQRDRLPRDHRDPPPEARRERDLGVGALEQRVQDELVERAVEVAAPVEERLRHGQPLAQRASWGARTSWISRAMSGSAGTAPASTGQQPIAVGDDAPAAHVEVEAAQELAVRARVDDERAADLDRLRQAVVGVAAEDHVEPAAPARRASGRPRRRCGSAARRTSALRSSRSSSTSAWIWSSRMPNVRSGTKRRGWAIGV